MQRLDFAKVLAIGFCPIYNKNIMKVGELYDVF